ncbi:hypothetical protein [Amycolatopsis aidingensis]|uniref:hypothetical protein n=1 Tax=Amycolatopsis aidingensis TaxID=2842453 RepID=UPI001C0AC98E|nr:hypothetical protein [Amycolatopsis aidingensis]
MPENQNGLPAKTALAGVLAVVSDIFAGIFVVAAYGITPQGVWDYGAIDVVNLVTRAGTVVALVVLVMQVLLVRPGRRLAWPWLVVPGLLLLLLIVKAVELEQRYAPFPGG